MSVKLRKLIFCAAPVLLGGACITPAEIRHNYELAAPGQVTLVGYLRSNTELTLYENLDDAVNYRPRKCINGTVGNMRTENAILYDKKLVKIKGEVKDYYLPNDDIEAMHVAIKNTCHSAKVFVATEISVL